MAAGIVRLRVALLGGFFRGSVGRAARAAAGLVVAAAAAAGLAWAPAALIADQAQRADVDVLIGSAVLIGCAVVPLFDHRRHLDPRQFVQYPASPAATAAGLLIGSIISWPFVVLLVWVISLGLLRPEWAAAGWVQPVSLVVVAVLAPCLARVFSGIAQAMIGQRFAGGMRAMGVFLLVALLPVAVFAATQIFSDGGDAVIADAADALGWTPFGAPFAALAMAGAAGSVARLCIAAAVAVVLIALWIPLAIMLQQRIERPVSTGAARSGLGWFERFAARPSQVIAARQLTYWARDPRYRVALFAIPVAPIVMLVAFWVAGAEPIALALVPLPVILLLLGWSQHNDVAMDSTAIWTHVASGTRGRADRLGRLAPVLMLGVPLAVIGSSITVTVLGEWRVLPAVVGLNIGVLLVSCGVSSVFSVLMPYPTTRPGDSPFMQPQWSGSGSGLAQSLSMLVTIVLSVPVAWMAVIATTDISFLANVWALGFGAVYGLVVLVVGVLIGGRIFDRGGAELIAVTQVFD